VDVTYAVVAVKNSVEPRPTTVETNAELLTYLELPNPATVDLMESEFMEDVYPNEPRPAKDDLSEALLI
jgi:hypothetical protein